MAMIAITCKRKRTSLVKKKREERKRNEGRDRATPSPSCYAVQPPVVHPRLCRSHLPSLPLPSSVGSWFPVFPLLRWVAAVAWFLSRRCWFVHPSVVVHSSLRCRLFVSFVCPSVVVRSSLCYRSFVPPSSFVRHPPLLLPFGPPSSIPVLAIHISRRSRCRRP